MKTISKELEVTSVACIIVLQAVQVGFAMPQNIFSLPPSGCICPGSNLTFECTIEGGGITVWSGNFFTDCSASPGNKEISFRHDRFDVADYYGTCNDGAVTARPHNYLENSIFTSQLHINMTVVSLSNGSTVTCAHDKDGEVTVVGTWTMIDPPMNLHREQKNGKHIEFSWDPVFPSCLPFRYNIRTTNCGSCPDSASSATVLCEAPDSELTDTQVCSIAVQTKCSNAAARSGNVSDIFQVTLKGDGKLFNTTTRFGGVQLIIYTIVPVGGFLLALIGAVVVTTYIKDLLWITEHNIYFYVSDKGPSSLSQALEVFKDNDVNITYVKTHAKAKIKNDYRITCREIHVSYECPKAKVKTLTKKLKVAGVELVNREDENDDTSASEPTATNYLVLRISVKEEKGILSDAVKVFTDSGLNIFCLSGGDCTNNTRSYVLECDCPAQKKKALIDELKCAGVTINDEFRNMETGHVEFTIPNHPGASSEKMKLLNEYTLRDCRIISFNMGRPEQGQQKWIVKLSYPKHMREKLQRDIDLKPDPEPEEA